MQFGGVLVVDKPEGITSFGVVARVRRCAGGIRTGHAGTLDPLATGVLVLALGQATKSIDQLMATDKRYRTIVDLSAFTTTDDREGERTEVLVGTPPSEASVREAAGRFVGSIEQRPPVFSAMKVKGRRASALARAGETPVMAPRVVRIDAVDVVRYEWPQVELDVRCGKGTYIRSLARDLGTALGTGGHCATLRRTAVGPFTDAIAVPFAAIPNPLTETDVLSLETTFAMLIGSAVRP
ncbi:MAG: tRNA pseudouridine(55) synthase TruB [Phycisphaerae bacterium]|nr:tRNA pseudouridine(55) synthase TruB [Phycisphaerae bacterium]